MRIALALGARGLGRTWPNPAVGAIIVRHDSDGPRIVGRGHTRPGGRPHAEAVALDHAGAAAIGATMYVTLEPCAHRSVRGATPCAERIMLSGLKRVVSAIDDPNRHIAGLGHALLRSFGLRVATGIGAAEALDAHRGHILRVTEGRPMVTLKLARTADGYAGAPPGSARLVITGEAAAQATHLERAAHDAIMVGIGTVRADDPRLDVRLPGMAGRSPLVVILDSRLRLAPDARLVKAVADRRILVVATEQAEIGRERRLVAAGLEVLRVAPDPRGRVDLRAALSLLAAMGLTRLFCEGGPALAEALAAARLIDRLLLLTGPAELGQAGHPALGPALAAAITPAGWLHSVAATVLGTDRLESFERE